MTILFKNLIVNFISTNHSEYVGDGNIEILAENAIAFWNENEGCEYSYELEEWIKERAEQDADEYEATFTSYNTDLNILFFGWCFEQTEKISFDFYGDTQFWLYHDFSHAQNDIWGGQIVVDQYVEEKRIFDALNELKERDELGIFTIEMRDAIENEFKTRWKYQIDIDAIDELCGFEDEEYDYEDEDEYADEYD